jgi:hypothetical protein
MARTQVIRSLFAMNNEVKTVAVVDYGMGNLRSVAQA